MEFSRKETARILRKKQTSAEEVLWQELRNNKLGFKFRRQYPIDKFFLDFYCFDKKLGIEIDGDIHKFQLEADKERQEVIKTLGIKIIRFKNDEVVNNLQAVLEKIKQELLG
jgi:very-short-patch-repair endonuclease